MRKHLYVDNVDLATYGVYCSGYDTYKAPEKIHEWYEVPNKDGAVLGIERRLRNVVVSYDCFIYTNMDANLRDLRNFLLSRNGLVRIADDYHTDEFRMGVYSGPFEPTITRRGDAGSFTLSFECQPQRWLTSGEAVISKDITRTGASQYLYATNPTLFPSKPLIRVTFDFSRSASYRNMTFSTPNGAGVYMDFSQSTDYTYIDIDCETMACYSGATNMAPYVQMRDINSTTYGVDFPVCNTGQSSFHPFSTATYISKIEVTPRWWRV